MYTLAKFVYKNSKKLLTFL